MTEILDYKETDVLNIRRKLKILKKRPTYERISELSQLIKNFICSDIDIFSYETNDTQNYDNKRLFNICTHIENIIENPEKYCDTKLINEPNEPCSTKSLDKILKEKLSTKLYEKVKQTNDKIENSNNLLNIETETEIIEDLLLEETPDSENEEEDEGYSLYEEESDDEENEFSD